MLPFQKRSIDFIKLKTAEGSFHLLKLGYITVQEQVMIDSQMMLTTQAHLLLLKLVQKICTQEGMSREEAAKVIDNPLEYPEIASKYTQDLEDILEYQAQLGASARLQEVTALIKYRAIHPDAFDDSGKILPDLEKVRSLVGIPDWSEADTLSLDQDLYKQISDFADREREKKQLTPSTSESKSSRLNSTSVEEPLTGLLSIGE